MNICSLQFFLCCCFVPIVFHVLSGKVQRQFFLTTLNVVFLSTFVPNERSWLAFALFIGGTFAMLRLIRRQPSKPILFLIITVVLAAFLLVKKYVFVVSLVPAGIWDHQITLIGVSYMLFKFIHMLVDANEGQLESFTFASYANYQLGFFSLVAGPIQRYNDYHQSWERMDLEPGDTRKVLLAWNRLLTGFIKMGCLAGIARYFYDLAGSDWGPQPASSLVMRFFISFYTYAIYLYYNFSGYTDIMIGIAYLFGFELPENFNQPYLARNLVEFWNRWHITLSHWIRDYVFMTSYKLSAEWFPGLAKYFGYFLLFFSLFLAGVWHGATANFAIFGLIQGVGVMTVQIYGDLLKWVLGRAGYQKYQRNRYIRWMSVTLTIHYFCFSLLFFSLGASDTFDRLLAVWRCLNLNGE